jgi:cell division protein FtsL
MLNKNFIIIMLLILIIFSLILNKYNFINNRLLIEEKFIDDKHC